MKARIPKHREFVINLEKTAEERRDECWEKLEAILLKNSNELSKIRKEYSEQLEKTVIQGLKDLNFLDVNFAIDFQKKKELYR